MQVQHLLPLHLEPCLPVLLRLVQPRLLQLLVVLLAVDHSQRTPIPIKEIGLYDRGKIICVVNVCVSVEMECVCVYLVRAVQHLINNKPLTRIVYHLNNVYTSAEMEGIPHLNDNHEPIKHIIFHL